MPGGEAKRGESRTSAAKRELREETGLKPHYGKYLFRHVGKVHKSHGHGHFQDYHTVCLVRAHGIPTPRREVRRVAFYKPGAGLRISGVTREIIERYYSYKARGRARRTKTSLIDRITEWLGF